MELQAFLFWVIAGLTGLSAVAVVVTQNIVRSATWLLFTLAGAAGIFFLLGADLVGAIQILVYVGGTLVLVIFGVMLTAQGPFVNMKTSAAEWGISATVGVVLMTVLALSTLAIRDDSGVYHLGPADRKTPHIQYAPTTNLSADPAQPSATNVLAQGLIGRPVGPAYEDSGSDGHRRLTRVHYLFPFEIVSIHLLVVLIGAAYLARAKWHKRTP